VDFREDLRNLDCFASARVDVIVAEGFSQTQERWLAGAVARSDFLQFPFYFQVFHDVVDVRLGSGDEMQAAENDVQARVDLARGGEDFLNPGVRTAVN